MPQRANDFRHYYANGIGIAFSDNDCRITFGIEEGGGDDMWEQTSISMTHRTLKILANHLTTIIQNYEAKTGVEIPFDSTKQDELIALLNKPNGGDSPT